MYRHPIGKLSKGAVLDVGLKCAHSCKFCYYSYLDQSEDQFKGMRKAKFRTLEECKEILRLLKNNGFLNFDVTGGEPTLHLNIIELMRYAHHDLGLYGRIITLGQFLMKKMPNCHHEKLIDDLLEAGLTNFLFSLHAVEEELFNKITGESFERLQSAMHYLDEKGFQYTSNTVAFSWNYRHLPQVAKEVLKHNIYLHNFIIMNSYYEWNNDGKSFGVQAKYSDIYPYLKEAVDILESNNIGVNIRYAPLCAVKGMEKNLVGMVGVRYDPYEWMNMAGHQGGNPEFCASVIPIKQHEIEDHLRYTDIEYVHENGIKLTGARGNFKHFADVCSKCTAKDVCDGIDPNYLKIYGSGEFTPYQENVGKSPIQKDRYNYNIPFLVKTSQYEDMKKIIVDEFNQFKGNILPHNSETLTPKISVVIPAYNCEASLKESVESVLSQTFQDFEIVIVNDGSTDRTKLVAEELIADYPNYKIRLINQENSGQPAIARNRGISEAIGEYILPLDSDDMIISTMLEDCLNLLKNNSSVAIAYTDRQDFGTSNELIVASDYNFERLKYANHLSYCALYRKKVWQEVGGYRTNIKGCEDWDFWIAAGAKGYFGGRIPKPLFKYRRNNTGVYQEVIKKFAQKFAQIVLNNQQLYTQDEIYRAEKSLEIIEIDTPEQENLKVAEIRKKFDLQDINLILFLDWNQSEETLHKQLIDSLKQIITKYNNESLTLLIDIQDTSEDQANSLVAFVVLQLFMEENLDEKILPKISFIGQIEEEESNLLFTQISDQIILNPQVHYLNLTTDDLKLIGCLEVLKNVPIEALKNIDFIEEIIKKVGLKPDPDFGYGQNNQFTNKYCGFWQVPRQLAECLVVLSNYPIDSMIEIGTCDGWTFCFMSAYLSRFSSKFRAVAVDISDQFKLYPIFSKYLPIEYYIGLTSYDFVGNSFDLAFIDGDHSFDWVFRDYSNVGKRAKYVMFHDINNKYVDLANITNGGVRRFWNELKYSQPNSKFYEFLYHPDQEDFMGIGLFIR